MHARRGMLDVLPVQRVEHDVALQLDLVRVRRRAAAGSRRTPGTYGHGGDDAMWRRLDARARPRRTSSRPSCTGPTPRPPRRGCRPRRAWSRPGRRGQGTVRRGPCARGAPGLLPREPVAQQSVHQRHVGLAAGRVLDSAHQLTERLLLAGAEIGRRGGVRRDRRVDERRRARSVSLTWARPRSRTSASGSPPATYSSTSSSFAVGPLMVPPSTRRSRRARPSTPSPLCCSGSLVLVGERGDVPALPVRGKFGWNTGADERLVGVRALARVGEHRRVVRGQPVLRLEAMRRAPRAAPAASRGRAPRTRRRGAAAAGPARGSSGSRAPAPCSAARWCGPAPPPSPGSPGRACRPPRARRSAARSRTRARAAPRGTSSCSSPRP